MRWLTKLPVLPAAQQIRREVAASEAERERTHTHRALLERRRAALRAQLNDAAQRVLLMEYRYRVLGRLPGEIVPPEPPEPPDLPDLPDLPEPPLTPSGKDAA